MIYVLVGVVSFVAGVVATAVFIFRHDELGSDDEPLEPR